MKYTKLLRIAVKNTLTKPLRKPLPEGCDELLDIYTNLYRDVVSALSPEEIRYIIAVKEGKFLRDYRPNKKVPLVDDTDRSDEDREATQDYHDDQFDNYEASQYDRFED